MFGAPNPRYRLYTRWRAYLTAVRDIMFGRFHHGPGIEELEAKLRTMLDVQRQDARIVSACVLSLSPSTLDRRMLFNSSLLFSAMPHLYRLPLLKMFAPKRKSTSRGSSQGNLQQEALPEVILIFTAREMRGQGIGLKLLNECERNLSAIGMDRYVVKTLSYAENRALKFYQSNGFLPKHQIDKHGKRYQVFEKCLSKSGKLIEAS